MDPQNLVTQIARKIRERYQFIGPELEPLLLSTINEELHTTRPFVEVSCRLKEGGDVYAVREFAVKDIDPASWHFQAEVLDVLDNLGERLEAVIVEREGERSSA